jgi:hypothetical protein
MAAITQNGGPKFIKNLVIYVKKTHHYDYTVQIWALSGLK